MLGMAAVAEPLIHTLIGAKWEPAIIYLQMLCFVGMMYPLHALNLNMLQVQGRSDLFLKLEVIKKIIAIPTIVTGVFFGIKLMIVGMMVNTLIAYYLNSYWSGVKIGYSFKQQVKDILPSFFLALSMGVLVYLLGELLPFSYPVNLIIQIVFGGLFILVISEVTKFRDYIYAKELVLEKIRSIKKR
jgi:O-antigen/teichoic acid export membrane protein